MKALFTHDHIFLKDNGGLIYSSGKLPYSTWERYLTIFDNITVAARMQLFTEKTQTSNLNISSGINVSFLSMPNLSNPIKMFTNRRAAIDLLETALQNVDVVIARLPSEIGALSVELAIKHGKPYVVEVVGCAWDALWNYGSLKGRLYAPYAFFRTKKIISRSPFALYVTKSFLQNRYPCNGYFADCSDVELSKLDDNVLGFRRPISLDRPVNIGLIGSLSSKYKGIETAIKAVKAVTSKGIQCELKILGAGDNSVWHSLAKDNGIAHIVKFDGVLPSGEKVNRWLDNIDLYIQPSLTEGLPRALVEAMSRGCPVLGSDVGGIPELLDRQCLIKPNDYKQLADKILWLINNPTVTLNYSKHNFEIAKLFANDILDKKRNLFWVKVAMSLKVGRTSQ